MIRDFCMRILLGGACYGGHPVLAASGRKRERRVRQRFDRRPMNFIDGHLTAAMAAILVPENLR
jgi:hypothetical protein